MSGTRKRVSVCLLALVVSVAMAGVVGVGSAGAAKTSVPVIDGVHLVMVDTSPTPPAGTPGTQPGQFDGRVTRQGKTGVYDIVLPFFAIDKMHKYELRNGTTVVDTVSVLVPKNNGDPISADTEKGGKVAGKVNHPKKILTLAASDGEGTLTYKAAKAKNKKK
jgi:hypothetical protein